jgi:hypothetical protein
MLKNSVAHQKKVDAAVWILQNTTGIHVPQAMILVGFSKADIVNKMVLQAVRHRCQQRQINACTGQLQGACWPESWGQKIVVIF